MLLAAGAAACAPGPVIIQVPFEDGDQAAVVAVVAGGTTEIFALDAADRDEQPILRSISGWRPEERVEVHALLYPDRLAALDVPAGRLTTDPDGDRALPDATRTLSAVLSGSDEVRWEAADRRPPALEALRLASNTPCVRMGADPERLVTADDERIVGLVQDAADRRWVALRAGADEHLRFREVRGAALGDAVDVDLGMRPQVALHDADGHIYVGGGQYGGEAQVFRGGPAQGFTRVAGVPDRLSSGWPQHLALADDGAVYALGRDGRVSRFEAGGVTVVAELGAEGDQGGLAWIGPDDLWALRPDGRAITRLTGGVARPVVTAVDQAVQELRDRLETLAVVPGLGTFIGTDGGVLLRLEGRAFVVAEANTLIDSTLEAMVPFGAGMLVVGRYGIVDQYYDGLGYCVDQRVFVGMNTTLRYAVVTPTEVVVAGEERLPDRLRPFVAFVRPAPGL